MRRRKNSQRHVSPLGGHIPNPPENCKSSVIVHRESDGTKWVDTYFCVQLCSPNFCATAKEHFNASWKGYKKALERKQDKENK